MNTNTNHYEQIANSVINKIYPFLINDLISYYSDSFVGKIILEIGTGPGFILKELCKEQFKSIYGIDISLDMLMRAKKRNRDINNLQLLCSSVESIPLKNESVDIIFSRGSMFFWKDMETSLREIYRTLRPGGFALIGGGYGISTPDSIINEIFDYYSNQVSKSSKPKIDIDSTINLMQSIGGHAEAITKPKRGFWLKWIKR